MNELILNKTSNLVMPANYIELDNEEMLYIDGGWKWSWGGFLSVVGGLISVAAGVVALATGAGIAGGILSICGGAVGIVSGILIFAEVD